MISQKTIEDVRNIHDIVGVVSEYVPLRQRGRNYIGLCPFHSEKSPSFTVSPEKGIFHCFGCHESGNLIGFIMKIDSLSFVEAIRLLATKKGIEIVEDANSTYSHDSTHSKDLDQIKASLTALRDEFKKKLTSTSSAYRYLTERGLSRETIAQFHLGVCPSEFQVGTFLGSTGLSPSLFSKTGIMLETNDGQWISRLRGRIVFPIIDHHGRTVGFGGRIIEDRKDVAKYINSEDSPLFNKRKLVYGLDHAKKAIKECGYVILVEGYMDVIVAHQFGFQNTVACMGTAVTLDQARLIKRYTDNVVVALDNDVAGLQAIEKSYPILKEAELSVKILQAKDKDPADILGENGADFFSKLIENSISMVEFKYDRLSQKLSPDHVENVAKILEDILPVLRSETDILIRKHYIKWVASQLKIESEIIVAKLQKNSYNVRQRLLLSTLNKKTKYEKAEEALVFLMATHYPTRQTILSELGENRFLIYRSLVQIMAASTKTNRELLDELDDKAVHDQLARVFVWGEQEGVSIHDKWQENMQTLKSQKNDQRIATLKATIKQLEQDGKDEELNLLLTELQNLTILSKNEGNI